MSAPAVSSSGGSRVPGHLLAMPLIILNMGVEMVYILEQRLRAQSIAVEKGRKVLSDVLKTCLAPKFIGELFKPQETYNNRATRTVFDKLAHSSIMRLNKSSMDKLYDLMSMGFKYQMLRCTHPSHLLQVTLNHLEAARGISDNAAVQDQVDAVHRLVIDTYSGLTQGEWWAVKHALNRFFQDRRVKVSLFLQDGVQHSDATLVLQFNNPLPMGTEPPGVVRYWTKGSKAPTVERVANIVVPGATVEMEGSPLSPETRACKLGDNMYARDRKPRADGSGAAGAGVDAMNTLDASPAPADTPSNSDSKVGGGAGGHREDPESYGRAALDLLASIISGAPATDENPTVLSLFDEEGGLASAGAFDRPAGAKEVVFTATADNSRLTRVAAALNEPTKVSDEEGEEEEDDLLALMDAHGKL